MAAKFKIPKTPHNKRMTGNTALLRRAILSVLPARRLFQNGSLRAASLQGHFESIAHWFDERVVDQSRSAQAGGDQDVTTASQAPGRVECIRIHDFRIVERHTGFDVDHTPQRGQEPRWVAFAGQHFMAHCVERAIERDGRTAIVIL
jgi:hypothetical protein